MIVYVEFCMMEGLAPLCEIMQCKSQFGVEKDVMPGVMEVELMVNVVDPFMLLCAHLLDILEV